MNTLILIKHSLPEIDPGVSPREWRLSEGGRARCRPLLQHAAVYQPERLFCSLEPKAHETGLLLAEGLSRPLIPVPDLHEQRRGRVPFDTLQGFESAIARLFQFPDQLVYGDETADEAYRRFSAALQQLLQAHPQQNLAVISHGTVITLFVSRACGIEPFPFWKRLGLPSLVVLSLPELKLLDVIDQVEPNDKAGD